MELSLPEFPEDLYGQLAFLAASFSVLAGLAMVVLPRSYARLIDLGEHERRIGAIGEVRAAGGHLAGFGAAALLLGQPDITLALGMALAFSAFGRILALMSDHASSPANWLLLLIQIALAFALTSMLFEVWTPESIPGLPEDPQEKLAFFAAAVIAIIGGIVMFAPRIALVMCGLSIQEGSESALGGIRAFGGFALGTGVAVMMMAGPMLYLALGAVLLTGVAARLISLVADRGNFLFQAIAIAGTAIVALTPLQYVFGMM